MASISHKLSRTQLQRLAVQCGIQNSGSKTALVTRLTDAIHGHRPPSSIARVLSIDLGIRNLGLSLVSPPPSPRPLPSAATRPRAVVHAWQRLALAPGNAARRKGDDGATAEAVTAPDFSPAGLADIAVRLVRDHLLPHRPTHVLIERQRFRSGGGAAVFEWTVRVNSLEAMLYAALCTMRELEMWRGDVVAVEPKRVGSFFLEGKAKVATEDGSVGDEESKAKRKGASGKETKKQKIDLLGRWLLEGDSLAMATPEASSMRDAYLQKWTPKGERKGKGAKTTELASMTKLDDLADSILQGVAWLKWEENKSALAAGHLDLLLRDGIE